MATEPLSAVVWAHSCRRAVRAVSGVLRLPASRSTRMCCGLVRSQDRTVIRGGLE